jgi:hypothetical protein
MDSLRRYAEWFLVNDRKLSSSYQLLSKMIVLGYQVDSLGGSRISWREKE